MTLAFLAWQAYWHDLVARLPSSRNEVLCTVCAVHIYIFKSEKCIIATLYMIYCEIKKDAYILYAIMQ